MDSYTNSQSIEHKTFPPIEQLVARLDSEIQGLSRWDNISNVFVWGSITLLVVTVLWWLVGIEWNGTLSGWAIAFLVASLFAAALSHSWFEMATATEAELRQAIVSDYFADIDGVEFFYDTDDIAYLIIRQDEGEAQIYCFPD